MRDIFFKDIVVTELEKSTETKQKLRELDKYLGEQYRQDPSAVGMTYSEYKKQWQESIKLKQLKTRYSPFEPMPGESVMEFKKRLKSVTILVPSETMEEFEQRMGSSFHK